MILVALRSLEFLRRLAPTIVLREVGDVAVVEHALQAVVAKAVVYLREYVVARLHGLAGREGTSGGAVAPDTYEAVTLVEWALGRRRAR